MTPERVVLSMSDQNSPPPAAPPADPLPGGGHAASHRARCRRRGGGSGGPHGRHLSLRYDAPALGAVDLRFELDPGSLRVAATLARRRAGRARARPTPASCATRSEALGPPVTVDVSARREPLDVYA